MLSRLLSALCLPLALLSSLPLGARAQSSAQPATVPVLMLSDIHFDPFHDPGKFAQLQQAPAIGWSAILSAPDTPTQAADFAALQQTCKAKGVDTPWSLFASSLTAEHAQPAAPLFLTVSGDLMAHQFECRYRTLAARYSVPDTPADYSAFAAKTVAFVALELRLTFRGIPIYFALGNNDSSCKDYLEDPDSAFLREDARSFAMDALSLQNAGSIVHEAPHLGDADLELPPPFHNTRLLVMQDVFEARKYSTCGGTANEDPARQQIAWLRARLTAARAAHQHVWVMAHMPPGIDAYSTFSKGRDVCSGDAPEMFLRSEALADTLTDFADVIRLALFGHTHMDELRVYTGAAPAAIVPGKLVPSISPVDGNNPAFTVAQVEPASGTLQDYAVFAAGNQTGIDTQWSEEYRFSSTYHLADLSGPSLARLTTALHADPGSATPASRSYEHFYFVTGPAAADGSPAANLTLKAAALRVVWPAYTCSLTQATAAGFTACVCPAKPSH